MATPTASLTLEKAIKNFLTDLATGHSPATVRTYQVALNRLTLYLSSQLKLNPAELTTDKLEADWAVNCLRWLSNPQNEENAIPTKRVPRTTLATYIAGITRFYKWCTLERIIVLPSDEYERMTLRFKDLRGKIQRTILDKVPPDEVIEALLATARLPLLPAKVAQTISGFKGDLAKLAEQDNKRYELIRLRNIAVLETLKSSGARISELTSLTRGDLDATNRRARVIGKGSKERWIYFSNKAWKAVQDYLQVRSHLMLNSGNAIGKKVSRGKAGDIAGQAVFAQHHRGAGWKTVKPLNPDGVRKMLWELVEKAELEVHITPHKFRHWFATKMLATTGDLAATQDLLGHANPATTRIYAQVSEISKQNLHRQVFDD
jgi:site-specific recombinase XerD